MTAAEAAGLTRRQEGIARLELATRRLAQAEQAHHNGTAALWALRNREAAALSRTSASKSLVSSSGRQQVLSGTAAPLPSHCWCRLLR